MYLSVERDFLGGEWNELIWAILFFFGGGGGSI